MLGTFCADPKLERSLNLGGTELDTYATYYPSSRAYPDVVYNSLDSYNAYRDHEVGDLAALLEAWLFICSAVARKR